MGHSVVLVLGVGSAILTGSAQAQVQRIERTPTPTLSLGPVQNPPLFNVSSMKVVLGQWTIKPVYQIADSGARVKGLLVFASPESISGDNISAVYYERAEASDCEPWAVFAWSGVSAAKGVVFLKERYGIPVSEDSEWEVTFGASIGAGDPVAYSRGFLADDPYGELTNRPLKNDFDTPG